MNLNLEGKTALVTGSTAGIGFAIAQTLASEGAQVIVNGRTQERVDAALAAIRKAVSGAKLDGFAADLGKPAGCESIARKFPSPLRHDQGGPNRHRSRHGRDLRRHRRDGQ